jgi:hypothetical protein
MPDTVIEEFALEGSDNLDTTDPRIVAALQAAGLVDDEF